MRSERKHILPHINLFTIALVERSANRIFSFYRENPVEVVGSEIAG